MSPAQSILQDRISQLLSWEKTKRRERTIVTLFFYVFIAALATMPLYGLLPPFVSPWLVPVLLSALMGPFFFVRDRWRRKDTAQTISRADKALSLDERAITAWEILERKEAKPAELLVLKEAEGGLKSADPTALFQRQLTWQAYLILPLFLVWVAFLWLDVALQDTDSLRLSAPRTVAQRLKDFSRELQEKSKGEGLHESLLFGNELEKVAQKRLDGKTNDEAFKKEVAAMAQKSETMARSAAGEAKSLATAESQQILKDLKAELEVARDSLNLSEASAEERGIGAQLLERLAGLPQLRKQIEESLPSLQRQSPKELRSFLDKLDRETTSELDRRSLLEAQEFLQQLLKQGEGQPGEAQVRVTAPKEQGSPNAGEKDMSKGSRPGDEPGKKEGASRPLAESAAGAATQLKGLLGEGKSAGLVLKGKPSAGKGEVSQDEMIVSYRRQAEAELNTERVPEGLKETIRNYFLSLGMGEGKR